MTRSTPLVQQLFVLKTLSTHRYGTTVQKLARELEVHEKTVRRDLRLFRQAGFPLQGQAGDHGRTTWHVATPAGAAEISFALDEALALYLGRRFLEALAGTYLCEAAQSAFKKVRALLGPAALRYLDQMTANLHLTAIGTSDYTQQAELVDTSMQAIEERKAVILLYRSLKATEPVEYEVCPYGLAYHKGSLYLVAHSRDHDELRVSKSTASARSSRAVFLFTCPPISTLRSTSLAASASIRATATSTCATPWRR